jgi:hypothetical protein
MKNLGSFKLVLSVNEPGHGETPVRKTRDRGVTTFGGKLYVWKRNGSTVSM